MGKKKKPERPPTPTEIRNASEMHYEVYLEAKKKKITSTHRMILFYAVECRLKELLYREFRKEIIKKRKSILWLSHVSPTGQTD